MEGNEAILTGLANIKTDELVVMKKQSVSDNSFRESLVSLLGLPVDRQQLVELMNNENVPDCPTIGDFMAGAMIMKACYGDTRAYEVVRDTIGQKPADKVYQDTTINVTMADEVRRYGE